MSDSMTAQGNIFRDRVRQLIELIPGCSNVQAEYQVGTQPVDLYYEEGVSFRRLRVVCECKDYGRPLTKTLIARHIYLGFTRLCGDLHRRVYSESGTTRSLAVGVLKTFITEEDMRDPSLQNCA